MADCERSINFDTGLIVLQGSCDGLQCVTSNDDACGHHSIVTWPTVKDQLYFIVVQGGMASGASGGEFTLRIGGANDICQQALGPLAVDAQIAAQGSNVLASNDYGADPLETFLVSQQVCIDAWLLSYVGAGVWYYVEIDNNATLVASTCDSLTEYDTQINIYQGLCGELECVTGTDDSCGYHSHVEWFAVAGRRYYILVHNVKPQRVKPQAPFRGTFILRVGKQEEFPTDGPWAIERQFFDTQISVYSGSCDNPACTVGQDGDHRFFRKSTVTWIGEEGGDYFVVVHGGALPPEAGSFLDFGTKYTYYRSGIFDLRIQEEALAFTDSCVAAIGPLPTNGYEFFSTTESATVDSLGSCGFDITAPGVW